MAPPSKALHRTAIPLRFIDAGEPHSLGVTTSMLHFLFPSDPLDPKEADDIFREQAEELPPKSTPSELIALNFRIEKVNDDAGYFLIWEDQSGRHSVP